MTIYRCPTHGWTMSADVVVSRAERNGDCQYQGGGCYAVGLVTLRGKEAAADLIVRIHGVPADNSPKYLAKIAFQNSCEHIVTLTECEYGVPTRTWCKRCGLSRPPTR